MARIGVEIVGDSRSLERAFSRSAKSATKFNRDIEKMTRGVASGSGLFRTFGRSIAFASGGFLAFASVSHFLRESIDAARDAAIAQRSLGAQLKANGESFAANREQVEKVSLSYGKFGFENDEVIKSLTVLDRGTGNITEAMKLQTLAAEIARVRQIDLAAAATIVAKVFGGQETALRRAVPGLAKTAHGYGLIREAQQKLAGQAAANTTAAERFHAILHNTEEIIGGALLPILNKYLNALGKWLDRMNRSGKLERDLRSFTDALSEAFGTLRSILDGLNKVTGSTVSTFKALLGVFLAYKALNLAASFGAFGAAIGGAEGSASALRGTLAGRAGLTVAVGALSFELTNLALRATGADKALERLGGSAFDFLSGTAGGRLLGLDPGRQFAGRITPEQQAAKFLRERAGKLERGGMSPQEAADLLVKQHPLLAVHDAEVFAGVTAAKPTIDHLVKTTVGAVQGAVSKAFGEAIKKVAPGADLGPPTAAQRKANEALRKRVVDEAQFAVDRTALTKSTADDLAALEKLNALLLRRLKGGHDELAIRQQQLQVQLQINDLIAQQQEARRQAALRAREAAQFRALGLGPTGEERIPGLKALRKQLEQVMSRPLDKAGRGVVERIRRVLFGQHGFGKLTRDVRAKIKEMLDGIDHELNRSVGVDITRFQETARGQFVFAGAHPAGMHVQNQTINLYGVQNVKEFEEALRKRNKQRAHNRRGHR